jgi:hypothetical protein
MATEMVARTLESLPYGTFPKDKAIHDIQYCTPGKGDNLSGFMFIR